MSTTGRFVWRELVSTHTKTSQAFYTELFGWGSGTVDMPTGPYTMFKNGERDAGGMMAAPAPDMPSHWVDYITVEDVDASLAVARGAGAQVHMAATDIPVGRFAVLSDPSGAVFALFKSSAPASEPPPTPGVGSFCWSQLMTKDVEAATSFYAKVFGWEPDPGPGGMVVFKLGDVMVASAMPLASDDPTPDHWLDYVLVEDADLSCAKANELGAKTLAPPMTLEGMGRFAVLADPAGAIFSVWKHLGAPAQ